MIQLLLALGGTSIALLIALIFKSKKNAILEALLKTSEVKKDVAVGDQEIKDAEKRAEEKKRDVSNDSILDFLNKPDNK